MYRKFRRSDTHDVVLAKARIPSVVSDHVFPCKQILLPRQKYFADRLLVCAPYYLTSTPRTVLTHPAKTECTEADTSSVPDP
jgi:hypothetical protein